MNCSFPKTLTDHEGQAIYLQSAQVAIRRREFSDFAQSAIFPGVPSRSKIWRVLLRFGIRAVGPINQSLVARCSTLASGKRGRATMNKPDRELLSELFMEFANSPLSSLCYGAYSVVRSMQAGCSPKNCFPEPIVAELNEIWSSARPIRLSNGMLVLSPNGRRHLPDLWQRQGHNPATITLAQMSMSRSGDLSAAFLPWAIRMLECKPVLVRSTLLPAEKIFGIPSYGLDGQTKLGRTSLALYLANSKAMQSIIPFTRSADRAVWIVSQIVRRAETEPIAEQLVPQGFLCLTDFLADHVKGLDAGRVREGRAIVADEIGLLNACRREVVSNVR